MLSMCAELSTVELIAWAVVFLVDSQGQIGFHMVVTSSKYQTGSEMCITYVHEKVVPSNFRLVNMSRYWLNMFYDSGWLSTCM